MSFCFTHVVIAQGLGGIDRRKICREAWVPTGKNVAKVEDETGIIIRFLVGQSEQKGDPVELSIKKEMEEFDDILRLDHVEAYKSLAAKTLKLFSVLVTEFDADFYFKLDDDIAVNVYTMADYLAPLRTRGNLFLGCMMSGQVLSDPYEGHKNFEPEHWRFGDPIGPDGYIGYMRYASGNIYGLSSPVAHYISQNREFLHHFANEDVSMGAWLLGTNITYQDELRLCCIHDEQCAAQISAGSPCIVYTEAECSGICNAETRMKSHVRSCLQASWLSS
eukprot:jgi/Botrbrau1/18317/Bobra.0179s0045.1